MTQWDPKTGSLALPVVRAFYQSGGTPQAVFNAVFDRIDARGLDPAWIALRSRQEVLDQADALDRADIPRKPLWGVPFGVKDNLDLAGMSTTNGCRAHSRRAVATTPIVQCLINAGAIPVGKNNMDQFGVGINGTRTDFGVPRCAFNDAYISGGSTSGGGVVVAAGLVSFAIGGDAAGSGRVPAALNNIVGLKPTPGLVPNTGVPTVAGLFGTNSLLTLTVDDAVTATQVIVAYDPKDPFSKPEAEKFSLSAPDTPSAFRFAVPDGASRYFADDTEAERLFDAAVARLEDLGGTAVPTDITPFLEQASALYEGPFIAQRTANLEAFLEKHEEDVFPATREILGWGHGFTAKDLFRAEYKLREVKQFAHRLFKNVALLATPTTPTTVTVAQMLADNIGQNAMLGTYTNFVNLVDLPAISVPAGFREDGIPLGLMLIGARLDDARLAAFASAYQKRSGFPLGATGRVYP
ncbi:MAG: amidase family protein [Pseudomonadota bacterium]